MFLRNRKVTISVNSIYTFLTFAYLASTSIFIMFSWGRYAMLGFCLALLAYSASKNRMEIRFRRDRFLAWEIGFTAFCFCSVLWAVQRGEAFRRSISVLEIALLTELINIALPREGKAKILLRALMWAGYAEALYLLFAIYTGRLSLLSLESGRMSNSLGNANYVGMIMAITIIVTLYYVCFEKARLIHLLALPCVYILILSQSRTAFIGFLLGLVFFIITYAISAKNSRKMLLYVFLITCGCILLVYIAIEKHLLDALLDRTRMLLAAFSARGGDNSANVRLNMIQVGFQTFLKYPLLGTGIGTSGVTVLSALKRDTYFHNNYIELLACGGILGFIAYYWPCVYMLRIWRKCRLVYWIKQKPILQVALVLLLMLLIMDLGTVSYYMKNTYYYMLLLLTLIDDWKTEAFSDNENE